MTLRPRTPLCQLAILLSSLVLTLATSARPPTGWHRPYRIPQLEPDPVLLNNTSLSAEDIKCFSAWPGDFRVVTDHKCAEAILKLDSSREEKEFHHGFPNDGWSLPISKTVGYCKVTVDMVYHGTTVNWTWSEVRFEASTLNLICQKRHGWRYRGALLETGPQRLIKISIEYKGVWAGTLGNRTAVREIE